MTKPRLADAEVYRQWTAKKGRKHRQYWSDKENDARQYWYPVPEGEEDTVVYSVTTILKMIAKNAIPQWYADQVAAKIAAFPDAPFTRTETETFNFFRWAGSNALKEAGELGDKLHSYAERDLLGEPQPEDWTLTERDQQLRDLWHELRWEHNLEPIFTEVTGWSHTHGYAGTIDGIGYLDGKLTLWDIKTSRNLWDEHKEQLAALGNVDELLLETEPLTWEAHELPEIEQYAILHVRPDDHDGKGVFVPGYWQVLTFPTEEINDYFPTFLGALAVKKGRELTKKYKQKEVEDD